MRLENKQAGLERNMQFKPFCFRLSVIFLTGLFLLFCGCAMNQSKEEQAEPVRKEKDHDTVVLLHTNDVHSEKFIESAEIYS